MQEIEGDCEAIARRGCPLRACDRSSQAPDRPCRRYRPESPIRHSAPDRMARTGGLGDAGEPYPSRLLRDRPQWVAVWLASNGTDPVAQIPYRRTEDGNQLLERLAAHQTTAVPEAEHPAPRRNHIRAAADP